MLVVCVGFGGATLSGTPITAVFFVNVLMLGLMWLIGSGLRGCNSVVITEPFALIGVFVSCGFLLLSMLGLDLFSLLLGESTNRPTGLYLEPSHYALFTLPLWIIAYRRSQYRPWLYAALMLSLVFSYSLTLLLMILFTLFFTRLLHRTVRPYRMVTVVRDLILIITTTVICYFISSSINILEDISLREYTLERINSFISDDKSANTNLSVLVVLQGIDLAKFSFLQSCGLGVGVGNMGLSEEVAAMNQYQLIINSIMQGGDLNLRDGGVLMAKIVGEFGLLALLVPLIFVNYIRRIAKIEHEMQLNYHRAFPVLILGVLFVRALPYYSAPVCLAIFSIASVFNPVRIPCTDQLRCNVVNDRL